MENLFRVISTSELKSAMASGVVTRCASDERSDCVHLNLKEDLETVANLYFTPEEAPVALELRRADIEKDLSFAPPTDARPFRQARLSREHVQFSSVVAVHPLEVVQLNGVPTFKFPAGA